MKAIRTSVFALAFFFAVGVTAMAVDITLSGTIPVITSISVTPEPDIANLDLSADLTDKKIATVVELSNKRTGYTVTIQSANAGSGSTPVFKGSDVDNTDTIDYAVSYGGAAATFSGGIATVTDASAKTTKDGASKDVAITVGGASVFPNADTYSDTLTFTITAK